ncbi:DUF3040 domain-containing protein [Nonomuraea sp. SYSU D8015]|uniref:DUF3040 domain-containing protein n=1 Tax=Nonomuraea sp. SYSU D8015 TaxID=2593644 RepID=UPI0016612A8A|nr:DUF3040 domain-containing protein [Nonomuraea sp. SYSU D8015]
MSLSRQEQRALEEIEERLAFEDPDLDALLARPHHDETSTVLFGEACRKVHTVHTVPGQVWRIAVLLFVSVSLIVLGLLLTTSG